MNVYYTVPRYKRLAGARELSRKAKQRLRWFDYCECHDHNTSLTRPHFGIFPQSFYRWKKRYDPKHIESLQDLPHRARHLRQAICSPELVAAVLRLREEYPRRRKDKLAVLLRREGLACPASTASRILKKLKEGGALKELVLKSFRWMEDLSFKTSLSRNVRGEE